MQCPHADRDVSPDGHMPQSCAAASSASAVRASFCDLCRIDLQSATALAQHVQGRKHLNKLGRGHTVASKRPMPSMTEADLLQGVAAGRFRNIVVLSGAGISTAAGVPDFRSEGGMFDLARGMWGHRFPELLREPEAVFTRSFILKHPSLWRDEVRPWLATLRDRSFRPTLAHHLCARLHRLGVLLRVYTQNVDGLHGALLPADKVVECHGSLRDGSLVMYGDSLPTRVERCCDADFGKRRQQDVDLILVLGTSLQVAPFCAIPNLAPKGCVRCVVSNDIGAILTNNWSRGHGMSEEGLWRSVGQVTSTKIGSQLVSLKPKWGEDRHAARRWSQLLIEDDCDSFAGRMLQHLDMP